MGGRQKYFGLFTDAESVLAQFGILDTSLSDMHQLIQATLLDKQILFAMYTYEDYSGRAFVLLRKDRKLYEVNGSHCSCNGLEGQWNPAETTWAVLAIREWFGFSGVEWETLNRLIARFNRK